ncbi:MAG TPA: hypothetical protein PLL30_16055 [Candidatus Krumholzibacteria bacterium]|nr:hypothetical protein [Candidatus Krumholzibacteria bacterium]HPD73284.1 hypothetical protein [Candidatus Krumholzibacteria bacterium]HRY42000.1 hypothetical protein [Candidatus Krumholzibacteria bacterium]
MRQFCRLVAVLPLVAALALPGCCDDNDEPTPPEPEVGTIVVDPSPDAINPPWELLGPDDYVHSGEGDETLEGRLPGEYTITWVDVDGYITPTSETLILAVNTTAVFAATYEATINYLPRVSPDNVWENCRLALENKDTAGWNSAISENFGYVPDPDTEQMYPTVDWANWGKDAEMFFINGWFATDIEITANLRDTNVSTPHGSGGVAEWEIIYFLSVLDNPSGATTRYRANAILRFTLEGPYWCLSYWRDQNGETDPENPDLTLETMGRLRGVFTP